MRALLTVAVLGCGASCSLLLSGSDVSDDAGAGSDGSPRDGGVVTADECAPITTFEDNFGDTATDSFWAPAGNLSEGDGALTVIADMGSFAGYTSADRFDLREQRVSVGIVPMLTDPLSRAQLIISAQLPVEDTRVIEIVDTNLDAREAATSIFSMLYVPSDHRFLQLRSSGSRLFYEASPDNKVFETLFEEAAYTAESSVALSIGIDATLNDLGSASFSDFAFEGRPKAGWCTGDKLVDDFEAAALSPTWLRLQTGDGDVNVAGQLALEVSAGGQGRAGIVSRGRYNLDGSAIEVEFAGVSAVPGVATVVEVRDSSLSAARFRIVDNLLIAESAQGGEANALFVADEAKVLRFEGDGTVLTLSTRGDNPDPVTRLVESRFEQLLDVEVLIYLEAAAPATDAISVIARVGPR